MLELEIQEYLDNLIGSIIKDIESCPQKSALASVVLTGSLGRDEGTFHLDKNTSKAVLDSDVELALVYKNGKKKEAEAIKATLISKYTEDMNPMTISETRIRNGYNFNYSILPPKNTSIFMYDFYNGSKTIWGEDLLTRDVPQYDRYEAKRIVANRIGELTCVQTGDAENKDKLITQWKGKLVLAIGSAYCILQNKYQSKYEAQRDYIVSCNEQLSPVIGQQFVEDYDKTFLFLRKGGNVHDIPMDRLIHYVDNVDRLFCKEGISHPKINSFSRNLKYAIACVRSKAHLNPLTCEEKIIDELIDDFVDKDDDIFETAKNWKNILY